MSTPSVQTSYANGSGNTVRLASRTYPDGRVVSVDYGTAGETDDLIGRVAALVDDDDTTLAEYQYLGLGAVVQQDSPEADLRFTLVNPSGTNDPDTGDIYSGLDRFGRVKDVRWRDVSADSDLSRVQYGYDRASNRTFRRNASDTANHHDWLYGYDGLHRLQDAQRGTLNGGHTAITSPEFAQCWTLDPTGNWQGFRQADSGDPWDLVQARLANPVNEITGITNSTGPAWAQPAYDGAGNMTTIPQPADPTEAYTATYDAWNRLVQLVDPATDHTVQENEYDGRGFRIVRKSYTAGVLTETRHFYYTDGWRDVEERMGTSPDAADPDRQFVWGLRYIDDLVLRDRSDAGTLDERLYALQDANWNVTAVVDDAGDVQERYEYDPYGQLTVLSPDFVMRAGSSFGWETTYAGYRFDGATGLYGVRSRYYPPIVGTFLSRDVDTDFAVASLYLYGDSTPNSTVDPLGDAAVATAVAVGVGAVGGVAVAPAVLAVLAGILIGLALEGIRRGIRWLRCSRRLRDCEREAERAAQACAALPMNIGRIDSRVCALLHWGELTTLCLRQFRACMSSTWFGGEPAAAEWYVSFLRNDFSCFQCPQDPDGGDDPCPPRPAPERPRPNRRPWPGRQFEPGVEVPPPIIAV